ncbi:uncharacterized protein LOC124889634 [Capsicum annuum]|uniref:uncharacterized protein LOC124889634 n=1 Tax=Capsicum annuum TaxID=4072 RepID=UPI001FB06B03|nr:uncharacterized protein LOC124889634 [Capsicum annuum]
MLGNLNFRPLESLETMERIHFGPFNLIAYPESNISFRIRPDYVLDRPQRCLVDNLWISYNRQNRNHFMASMNALCHYMAEKSRPRFKYYVVIHGKTNGIFQTWLEVLDSIQGFKAPLFKGFNDFTEATNHARGYLGPNYYISPSLRQNPDQIPQYNLQKETGKIIFCNHCSSMTENFKTLNAQKESLLMENTRLIKHIQMLETKLRQQTPVSKTDAQTQTPTQSSPSPQKMDEKGVHFPINAQKSTVPDVGTASPIQTVIGKDKSNPFMAVTLLKSEDEGYSSSKTKIRPGHKTSKKTLISKRKSETIETIIKQTLDRFFSNQTQDKYMDGLPDEQPDSTVPEINNTDNNSTRSNEEDSIAQFQDAQDPYEDDDSGMGFDSIALHNLDT